MTGTQKECEFIVSILNLIIERNGKDVKTEGFGYGKDGRIGVIEGDDIEYDLAGPLEEVWDIIRKKNKQNKMVNKLMVNKLIESILDRQKRMEEMRLDMRKDTEELIVACVGLNTPLTFNDETGFPYYNNDCETSPEPIVGVRVTGDEDTMTGYCLEFNVNCGDDEYGLNPDTWFCPYDHGTYDDGQLLTGIDNWIRCQQNK